MSGVRVLLDDVIARCDGKRPEIDRAEHFFRFAPSLAEEELVGDPEPTRHALERRERKAWVFVLEIEEAAERSAELHRRSL